MEILPELSDDSNSESGSPGLVTDVNVNIPNADIDPDEDDPDDPDDNQNR